MEYTEIEVRIHELLERFVESPFTADDLGSVSGDILRVTDNNIGQYLADSSRTFSYLEKPIPTTTGDELHCIMGMETEVGELIDAYKKHLFYGKPLDHTNIQEEIGDLMWYVANFCRLHDYDFQSILATNIKKLKARFPTGFDKALALKRNLINERNILDNEVGRNNQSGT